MATISKINESKIEIAEIFRKHIRDYLAIYNMPPEHFEVVSDIIGCRTQWLGGRIQQCDNCGKQVPLYNSCRNRHCPIGLKKNILARQSEEDVL